MKNQVVLVIVLLSFCQISFARKFVKQYYSAYSVKEDIISEEEYLAAKAHFGQYNYSRDTTIDPYLKKKNRSGHF